MRSLTSSMLCKYSLTHPLRGSNGWPSRAWAGVLCGGSKTSAICCRHSLVLARERAEIASLPLISHLGGWSYLMSAVGLADRLACWRWCWCCWDCCGTEGGIGLRLKLGACLIEATFVPCILNDFVGVLAQALLRMRLLQKALFMLAGRVSLSLWTCLEITVVYILKVFGNGVLIVAVHADFLLGPMRVVAVLKHENRLKSISATNRTSMSHQIKHNSIKFYTSISFISNWTYYLFYYFLVEHKIVDKNLIVLH